MQKYLVAFCLLVTSLVASAESPDYFPLTEGARWTYVLASNEATNEIVVVVSEEREGRPYTQVCSSSLISSVFWSYYEADGFVWTYRRGAEGRDWKLATASKTYKKNLKVGDHWTSRTDRPGEPSSLESRAVARETIKVPAGTFETIKVVELKKSGQFVEETTYWVADGVGVVKSSYLTDLVGPEPVVSLLESYQLKPTPKKPLQAFSPEGLYYLTKADSDETFGGLLRFHSGWVEALSLSGQTEPDRERVALKRVSPELMEFEMEWSPGEVRKTTILPNGNDILVKFSAPEIEDKPAAIMARGRYMGPLPRRFLGPWKSEAGDQIHLSRQRIAFVLGDTEQEGITCLLVSEENETTLILVPEFGPLWLRLLDDKTLCVWMADGKAYTFMRSRF